VEAPEPELYDLSSDPSEKTNLAPQQAATVAVLKDKLQKLQASNAFKPSQGENASLSPDALEKLRALGYVAYRSPVSQEALAAGLPDPKSKLWEFNKILEATDAFHAGDHAAGMALVAQVRERDPKIYILSFLAGESALALQKWDDAETEFKRCLELNPNFDQAMTGLSRALINREKLDEAKQWAQNALKFNPQNYRAWYQLGFIEAKKQDRQAAITAYEKAVSIQENFAPLRRDLGLLQFQQQNYAEAAKHLAAAVDLGMQDASLFNTLGISYSRTNRLQKAVASYKQALKLDPNRAETHLNLAYVYQRLNQLKAAREEYETACKLEEKFCQYVPRQQP
jgi:tetratricopeptide (TPR) repeat protein